MSDMQLAEMLRAAMKRIDALERLEMGDVMHRAVNAALTMPGVVGVWLGNLDRDVAGSNPGVVDVTGTQIGMVKVNSAAIGIDSNRPYLHYMEFPGTNEAFSIGSTSNNRITGTEGIMASGLAGLSFAAWAQFDNAASAVEPYISLWYESADLRGYRIHRNASGYIQFDVSSAGTAATVKSATHTTPTGSAEWVFTAGRFTPSTEMAVWRNLEKVTNTSSIPASIFQSSGDFRFGVQSQPGISIDGRVGFPLWLSIAAVPDSEIERFYYATAPIFLGA